MNYYDTTENEVEIVCVIDRSGSMQSIANDTIGGFNSFLSEQQKLEEKANMTVVLFDHEVLYYAKNEDVRQVKLLDQTTYVPRGSTALLDAIGSTIGEISAKNSKKVLFMILTDGYENSSKEYKRPQIAELIQAKEKEGWEFIYLGANVDAFSEARSLGISTINTANFVASSGGTEMTYNAMSSVATSYRTKGTVDYDALSNLNNSSQGGTPT